MTSLPYIDVSKGNGTSLENTSVIKKFLSQLSSQERKIIWDILACGVISDTDMNIIKKSDYDIKGFLENSHVLPDIEKWFIMFVIEEIINQRSMEVDEILSIKI